MPAARDVNVYVTIWQNWETTVQSLEESARRGYARTTLANHARNLNRLRHKQHEELRSFSDEDIHDISGATSAWRDPAVEIVFRDGELMIYRAIAHLHGEAKGRHGVDRPWLGSPIN